MCNKLVMMPWKCEFDFQIMSNIFHGNCKGVTWFIVTSFLLGYKQGELTFLVTQKPWPFPPRMLLTMRALHSKSYEKKFVNLKQKLYSFLISFEFLRWLQMNFSLFTSFMVLNKSSFLHSSLKHYISLTIHILEPWST